MNTAPGLSPLPTVPAAAMGVHQKDQAATGVAVGISAANGRQWHTYIFDNDGCEWTPGHPVTFEGFNPAHLICVPFHACEVSHD